LVVFGVGYVLGTRAGRERYEQIVNIDGFSRRVDGIKARLRDYSRD
jgi:hypothetical protein